MATLTSAPAAIAMPRGPHVLAGLYRSEPFFTIAGLLFVAAMVPTAFAGLLDDRLYNGVDIWTKPMKFHFALAVYLLTLAFYARWLPAGMVARPWYRIYAAVVLVAILGETLWISGAAALGTGSHFNTGTPLAALLFQIMGGLAAILTTPPAVYAVALARSAEARRLSPAVRSGLVIGLGLVLPLTLLTAAILAQNGSHSVGGTPDGAGLAFFGWSRDGGDLRVAHFFATHAMHFVPAFALVSALVLGRSARWPVVGFAMLYTGFVLFVLRQALAGVPFLPGL